MGLGKQEVDRLLRRCMEMRWGGPPTVSDWAPSMDISETRDSLIAKVEVPGMEQGDIQILLHEDLLTIRSDRKQEREETDTRYLLVERCHGAFTRTVRLPVPVDARRVTAAFRNGLLTITLPKVPAAEGTAIPIREE